MLIAPESGLPAIADEVRAISLSLRPVILNGTVTRRDVLDRIRLSTWDVVWFATHGDQNGIQLSDGYVSADDLIAVIRASGAWLVIINTCSSKYLAMEINSEVNVDVIATITDVEDVTAYQTGALLADALQKTKSPKAAYDTSKPGHGENYRYWPGSKGGELDEARTILLLNEWGARLSAKIDAMERRMDREIGELKQDIAELNNHVRNSVKLPPWHKVAFISAFTLLFVPVPLFYVQVRQLWGIEWHAALVLTFGSYTMSAILWGYMWWGGQR